jgi:hypothetical protein
LQQLQIYIQGAEHSFNLKAYTIFVSKFEFAYIRDSKAAFETLAVRPYHFLFFDIAVDP